MQEQALGDKIKIYFVPLILIIFCAIIIFITVSTGLDVTRDEDQQASQVASMQLGLVSTETLSALQKNVVNLTYEQQSNQVYLLHSEEDFLQKWVAESSLTQKVPKIADKWYEQGVYFLLTTRDKNDKYIANALVIRAVEGTEYRRFWVKIPLNAFSDIWKNFNSDLKWEGVLLHNNHPLLNLTVMLHIEDEFVREISSLDGNQLILEHETGNANYTEIPNSDFTIYLVARKMGWSQVLNQESLHRITTVIFIVLIAFFVIIEQTRSLLNIQKNQSRALRILKKSEERLKDLVHSSADYLWSMDNNYRFTYISPTITNELHVSESYFLNKKLEDITDEKFDIEDRHATLEAVSRFWPVRDKTFKFNLNNKDAFYLRLSGVSVFNKSYEFVGYRGTARNVTLEKQAMIAAEQSQSRLLNALNTSPDGFVLFDQHERLVLFNAAFEKLFFRDERSFLRTGRTFSDLQQRIKEKKLKSDVLDTALPLNLEQSFLAKEGIAHEKPVYEQVIQLKSGEWVLSSAIKTQTNDLVCLFRDITKLKENELALQIAKDKAEIADRTKSEFLAFMGHELRSPLNAIIGFSEVLRNHLHGPLGEAVYDDYVSDIHDSGLHLLTLVNDLLDFSKIEAGKMTLQEEIVDLESVVGSACNMVKERAQKDHIALENAVTLENIMSYGIIGIYADSNKVKQMLINILTNAIKFTPSGGKVSISISIDDAMGFNLTVRDNGIGIAEEDIKKVFEAYEQVDNHQGRRHKGTGLGMPLTRKLMTLHGGDIVLDSAPGTGTKVILCFPASRVVKSE